MEDKINIPFEIFDVNPLNNIKVKIEQTEEKCLYHYTSTVALMNILKNKQLWVSRSDFLNDSLEIKYMSNVIMKVKDHLDENSSKYINEFDDRGFFISELTRQLVHVAEGIENGKDNISQIFILSLSENKDSLTLFSNYSNYEGYNIGFNTNKLIDSFQKSKSKKNNNVQFFCSGKVNYDSDSQFRLILEEVLEVYNTLFDKMIEKGYKSIDDVIFRNIMQQTLYRIVATIQMYALFFKHPSFIHEEEYRVVFFVDPIVKQKVVKFRVNNSIIIPYVEINFNDNNLISSITIGPKNNIDIAKDSVQCYLEHLKYNESILVDKSAIPLRF